MADYISREAALELLKLIEIKESSINFAGVMIMALRDMPAADVRSVVLCKDCVHHDPEDRKCDHGGQERAGCVFPVADDYFCAYGERRADNG